MSVDTYTDNVESAVRYALLTTHATAACPFHPYVTIRIGDDAAETHAYYRARNIIKSDGMGWKREVLMEEIARQLARAADHVCPQCLSASCMNSPPSAVTVASATLEYGDRMTSGRPSTCS
jgi:hypothetical protein